MYLHARAWGIQPSEFWAMTWSEFEAEFAFHTKQAGGAGRLSDDDWAALAAMEEEDARNGIA